MNLLNPEYFWLLLLLTPLFIKKNFREMSFVSYGYIFTFLFIILALTRPVIEQEPVQSEQVLSDVIIAVDLSYSMHATDILPTRLEKAKEIVQALVKIQKDSKFGVVGFTTNAIVLSPLTEDSELLLHLFNSLEQKLVITKGSSVLPAIELSRKMSKSKHPSVVILSDGADEPSYEKEARFAKENGLIVNVFMIATQMGGTLTLENGELLKDDKGNIVVSRANSALSVVATTSGGVFTESLDTLLDALEEQKNRDFKTQTSIMKNLELFYYFVVLAILTFLVTTTTLKRFVIAFLLLVGVHLSASPYEQIQEDIAKSAYEKGEYKKAIEHYQKIDKSRAYFNLACAYYKEGEYEKALTNFARVKSSDAKFKSNLFYNMANTLVRLKEFKKAREAYLKSLTLFYTKEADENLQYIKDVEEEKTMSTGQQKTKNNSEIAKQEESSQKKKEGGGSNMEVSANASSGASDAQKKAKNEGMINLNGGKAKLSSKQYELINKRGTNEQKPW
ncbi:MAG: VWA domain-containing protein [Campylobacterales bacterium]|nr:VWA domain-containing protein [Campylobacterales bacterium]